MFHFFPLCALNIKSVPMKGSENAFKNVEVTNTYSVYCQDRCKNIQYIKSGTRIGTHCSDWATAGQPKKS